MSENLNLAAPIPFRDRTLALRKKFNRSLLDSFQYLLDSCEEAIPNDLYKLSQEKLSGISEDLKLSGVLSGIHKRLFDSVKKKDSEEAQKYINQFMKYEYHVEDILFKNLSNLDDYQSDLIKEISSCEIDRNISFAPLSSDRFQKVESNIKEALIFLKEVSPEFYEEALDLISEIVVLKGTGVQGGSSFDVFGLIHINENYKTDKITDLIDYLIHEESHLYLHMVMNDDPLVLNDISEKYESPLREEKRTMLGVYHATYVLSRIIYVLSRFLEERKIPASEEEYCFSLINHYSSRYCLGMEVIRKYARLSNIGIDIINSVDSLLIQKLAA